MVRSSILETLSEPLVVLFEPFVDSVTSNIRPRPGKNPLEDFLFLSGSSIDTREAVLAVADRTDDALLVFLRLRWVVWSGSNMELVSESPSS